MVDKEPKTDLTLKLKQRKKNKEVQKDVYFYFRVQKDIKNIKNKAIALLGNSVIC